MTTLDELIQSYTDENGNYISDQMVDDVGEYFVVNTNLRTITIPSGYDIVGVSNDANMNILPFKIPRYYDGVDLSTMKIYVNYLNANRQPDRYLVDNVDIREDCITFNWLTGPNVFVKSGEVTFSICMRLFDTDDITVLKEFNTKTAILKVGEGLSVDEEMNVPAYQDVLNQLVVEWDSRIDQAVQTVPDAVDEHWNSIGRDEAEADSQAYIDSKIIVMDKSDYDVLTEYATGVVYLVRE